MVGEKKFMVVNFTQVVTISVLCFLCTVNIALRHVWCIAGWIECFFMA